MFGFHPHHITRLLKAGGKSMDGYTCEGNAEYETVEEHSQVSEGTLSRLKELQDIRREVLIKSDKSSSKMVDKHLKTNPPSQYEVGEIVLVRHLGKDKGVTRGGQKITSPKAVEDIYMNVRALQKQMMTPTALSYDHLLQKLEDLARERGRVVKHNSGGGNCMFLSLSDQIYHVLNLEMNALEVRDNIVEHQDTPNTIDGTPLDQFVCTQQSWEDYLSTMEAPGTWGDHLVLLVLQSSSKLTLR
ncbi:uncharacterized protein LOC124285511 [Haliotis rubra]|uniref:uncharacterized protein LOC124285511 n=1 Tax=Haliotis rubra TaxID=36100 RepID=UPI001EE52B94|nr:uncharacterized protein LOC124285511 [Haliotis rubra]